MSLVIPTTHDVEEKNWKFDKYCYVVAETDTEGFLREIWIKRPNGYHEEKFRFLAENAGSTITLAEMELMSIYHGKY